MPHSLQKYLQDILIAINDIHSFLGEAPTYESYSQNLMMQYAVERALGIIGEASNHLRRIQPDIQISHLRDIINFRNMVIHAYDGIDNQRVWIIIIDYLPVLKKEVELLIRETESGANLSV